MNVGKNRALASCCVCPHDAVSHTHTYAELKTAAKYLQKQNWTGHDIRYEATPPCPLAHSPYCQARTNEGTKQRCGHIYIYKSLKKKTTIFFTSRFSIWLACFSLTVCLLHTLLDQQSNVLFSVSYAKNRLRSSPFNERAHILTSRYAVFCFQMWCSRALQVEQTLRCLKWSVSVLF